MISGHIVFANLLSNTRMPLLIRVIKALIARRFFFEYSNATNYRSYFDNSEHKHYNHYNLERASATAPTLSIRCFWRNNCFLNGSVVSYSFKVRRWRFAWGNSALFVAWEPLLLFVMCRTIVHFDYIIVIKIYYNSLRPKSAKVKIG